MRLFWLQGLITEWVSLSIRNALQNLVWQPFCYCWSQNVLSFYQHCFSMCSFYQHWCKPNPWQNPFLIIQARLKEKNPRRTVDCAEIYGVFQLMYKTDKRQSNRKMKLEWLRHAADTLTWVERISIIPNQKYGIRLEITSSLLIKL